VLEVRDAAALDRVAGLILPGGESTTQLTLLERHRLAPALDAFVRSGRPVLATCAGLILAARRVTQPEQPSFGWIDVAVARNGWGRQVASFTHAGEGYPMVFIRAPRIVDVGRDVQVLAHARGEPVLVRSRNVTGATFHPELTDDLTLVRQVFGGLRVTE
jgi:5'-phosphate synthase pdxT subunit